MMYPTESSLGGQSVGDTILEGARATTAALALVLIQDAIRMGQPELAKTLVGAARKRWGSEPGLCLIQTMLEAKSGSFEQARRALSEAGQSDPECAITQMYSALLAMEAGEPSLARRQLRQVVGNCPDYPGVAGMLASLLMPGPNYRDVLGCLHQRLTPRAYLEVGVETGATLGLASAQRIIGIDPSLAPLRRDRVAAHARLFEMTSDAFFERHQREGVLGQVPLDLAFIDGLHRFDAALADFHAIERWAHPKTVVVMHDALPVARVYAEAERRTRFWVGDVWKAVFVLLRHRPDLSIHIIPTVPSGLVVIRWRATPSCAMGAREISAMIARTEFPQLGEDDPVWPAEFPLVRNDAHGYAEALAIAK